jgi:hypothetical protein
VRKRGLTGSFWPSKHQELLLKAALLDPEEAIPAWRSARATLDIDRLEPGSYSLMPLVYRSLRAANVDEPLMPRLKGIYRHTWSKNQLLGEDAAAALAALARAGVDALAIGGLSRLRFYPELGLRTMTECEVLCRPDDVERALRALGWAAGESVPARVLRGRSTVRIDRPRTPTKRFGAPPSGAAAAASLTLACSRRRMNCFTLARAAHERRCGRTSSGLATRR